MKIKFTRSILVGGEHREQGSTADIPDAIAIDLLRSLDAVKAGDAPETATAKQPAKETAAKK